MKSTKDDSISIIGIACYFPGANTPDKFWQNLSGGKESVKFFNEDELLTHNVPKEFIKSSQYIKASPILEGFDTFDAEYFGYSPREAAILDPQQRLFLEVASQAFEDACYVPENYPGIIGCFAGAGGVVSSYLLDRLLHLNNVANYTGSLLHLGNDKDFISTRAAYEFNLTGPCISIQSACSTSLVALHLGCESLQGNACDLALVGASTIRIPHYSGYSYIKGGIFSSDGHCKPFDKNANGTIFGSGVAAVILKRTADAIKDNDNIYAVIRGTSINNDGSNKTSYTASSSLGQSKAIINTLVSCDINPESISFIECHGTGTFMGDPLEIEALTQSFRLFTKESTYCAVGSVKANIGHLEQTAGMAGLIKTVLALKYKTLLPQINYTEANPRINFTDSPFYINTTLRPWQSNSSILRAGINSLGMGGTNAFAILEEAPTNKKISSKKMSKHLASNISICNFTAKNINALRDNICSFIKFLETAPNKDISLLDICYSNNTGRRNLPLRISIKAKSIDDLKSSLAKIIKDEILSNNAVQVSIKPKVAYLLYDVLFDELMLIYNAIQSHQAIRDLLLEIDNCLNEHFKLSLSKILTFDSKSKKKKELHLCVAKFIIQYVATQFWVKSGVTPSIMICDNISEHVANCIINPSKLKASLQFIITNNVKLGKSTKQYKLFSNINSSTNSNNDNYTVCSLSHLEITSLLEGNSFDVIIEFGNSTKMGLHKSSCLKDNDALYLRPFAMHENLQQQLLNDLHDLYLKGCDINWQLYYCHTNAKKISLPTYVFQKKRYWLEAEQNIVNA